MGHHKGRVIRMKIIVVGTSCQKRWIKKLRPSINFNQSIKALLHVNKISSPTIKVINHKHLFQLSHLHRRHWPKILFSTLFQIVEKLLELERGAMIPPEIAINLRCFSGERGKRFWVSFTKFGTRWYNSFSKASSAAQIHSRRLGMPWSPALNLSEILLTASSTRSNWSS